MEVLPCASAKDKALHEVPIVVIDCLQVRDALLKNLKAMKVNIRSSSTSKVCRIKVVGLGLVKLVEESSNLTRWVRNGGRTTTNLKPRGQTHLNKSWTWEET